jgi:maltooligosyltrehalose trehalohydrolase
LDCQWNDDFHHALHVACTADRNGYYGDYEGFVDLATAFSEGFVYSGRYSQHRKCIHGSPSVHVEPCRFVVFSQNHDQVGNRFLGDRLAQLSDFESAKLAAAAVILSPYIPMLFMGEEYAELAPFLYFVSHGDEDLIAAVRNGRREEFNHFHFAGEAPDPQSEDTYLRSKLDHVLWQHPGRHRAMRQYYCELLNLRRTQPALRRLSRRNTSIEVDQNSKLIAMTRQAEEGAQILVLFAFGETAVPPPSLRDAGGWYTLLDSSDYRWEGPGPTAEGRLNPRSCVVLAAEVDRPGRCTR